jgi:Tfp pilus assembly protein PilZ
MSDSVSSARQAREGLAQGLGALQGPGVPDSLQSAAEPVAEAMGQLHRIESSGGQALAESAPLALAAARKALGLLQAQGDNPAVMSAMEAVAGSLGLIHGLTRMAPAPAPANAVPITAPMAAQEQPAPAVARPVAKKIEPAPQPQTARPEPIEPMAPTPRADAIPLEKSSSNGGGTPATRQDPLAATAPAAAKSADLESTARQDRTDLPTEPQGSPPQVAAPPSLRGPGGPEPTLEVEASLGANSDSNFFLGLSGSDVIEHGGVFIATYTAPPLGDELMLRVLLPGGFEFRARGLVAWTRSERAGIPGCGIRFTEISGEGAALVRRYVQKREPLLHDDL